MTYRERRERKADRLRDWSAKRERDAAAVHRSHEPFRGDIAFNTQPGHIPLRARVIRQQERAWESERKAREMSRRADGIEAQAERAIYSDDADAPERLRERIAELEAERERVKTYNASARKTPANKPGDLSILTEAEREDLLRSISVGFDRAGAFPAYKLTNLGGNIARLRKRLEGLGTERETPRERTITARYSGTCADCGATIERGDTIRYSRANGARCAECKAMP
jgi:hypothetical protein